MLTLSNKYNITCYQKSINNGDSDKISNSNNNSNSKEENEGNSYVKMTYIQDEPSTLVNYKPTEYSRYC